MYHKLEQQKYESLKKTHTQILNKVISDIRSTQLKLADLNSALAAAANSSPFDAGFQG